MLPPTAGLSAFLGQIEGALGAGLYNAALTVCLTIPDVCAGLASDPTAHVHLNYGTYTEWFDENAAHRFNNLTGADCYHLRGGVIHRGNFRHKNSSFDRVIFLLPGSIGVERDVVATFEPEVNFGGTPLAQIAGTYPGRSPTYAILQIDLMSFCQIMKRAAEDWLDSHAEDPHVRANLPNLVHLRSEGLPPYMTGIAVVA